MATRALERGTVERRLVASARVLFQDASGVTLATTSHADPPPSGASPSEPDGSTTIRGLLRLEAIGERAIRVRHALGDELRDDGDDATIVGRLETPSARVFAGPAGAEIHTDRLTVTAGLDPFELRLLDLGGGRDVRIGGSDRGGSGVADSLGTGISLDTADGRPVATETFSVPPGVAVHGFGEGLPGSDIVGRTIDLEVHETSLPFFATTGGYGVFAHTSAGATAWVGSRAANEVQLAIDDDVLDYVVFVGSVDEILEDLTALTGRDR